MTWQITLFNWTGFITLMALILAVLVFCIWYILQGVSAQCSNFWTTRKFILEHPSEFRKWYKARNKK